jgi:hypothetical protein
VPEPEEDSGVHVLLGFEAGVGLGPERINFGGTGRSGERFYYVEVDPWWGMGASIGAGVGPRGGGHPVLGIWEGIPLISPDCGRSSPWTLTFSAGYRYTGVHELYLAPKVGIMGSGFCD